MNDSLENYLLSVAGTPGTGLLCALVFALACYGIGNLFFRRTKAPSPCVPFALGIHLFAIVSLIVFSIFGGTVLKVLFAVIVLAGFVYGIRRIRDLKLSRYMLPPLAILIFAAGNLLVPPFGWDECVYQLAVPQRWIQSAFPCVYADLPYSGFPMLPQFVFLPLMQFGGALAAKAFDLIVLGAAALSLFSFSGMKRFAGTAAVTALLAAPVMLHLESCTYAEPFLALDLLAALLIWRRSPGLAGLCAGSAAAVKLTGAFFPVFLPVVFLCSRPLPKFRQMLCFLGGCSTGLLFYLRPLLCTGNPFYPYFMAHFPGASGAQQAMSAFHHAIGSASFGSADVSQYVLAPILMASFDDNHIYDGTWGYALLILTVFAVVYLFRRLRTSGVRRTLPLILLPILLYAAWWFSPQARFLLPCVSVLLILSVRAMMHLPRRFARLFSAGLILLALFGMFSTNFPASTLQRIQHADDPVNMFYSETGGTYLPAIDQLRKRPGKTWLIFEERTLYLPQNCEIATPFFQSGVLTPPDSLTANEFFRQICKDGNGAFYFRRPEGCPDLSPEYLKRCTNLVNTVLPEVLKSGESWNSRTQQIPGTDSLICELRLK